ncbi:MAG TPA: chorismate-binding protein [Beutenbergiaceae bacterium]|nr:chorismate-binding protein [Beutenbergiaceae bacterium]
MASGWARFAGVQANDVCDYADLRHEPQALARGGWWAVVAEFDGPWHAWRFARVQRHTPSRSSTPSARSRPETGQWRGPDSTAWRSTLSRGEYHRAIREVHRAIREGQIYQANICRVLSAPLPEPPPAGALARILAAGNPAPYAAALEIPEGIRMASGSPAPGAWVVSASPELGLSVGTGQVRTGPIKGTAATAAGLTEKDRAENVMILDLVRNDLQRVCRPGTVVVEDLLAVEEHPGLVHLVSRARGRLQAAALGDRDGRGWSDLLAAMHPPGSVSGTPKLAALEVIAALERGPRGPYCGQIGWIDADAEQASLAVGIRTFWWSGGQLHFGTGAGITIDSDPAAEWAETELKADRLVALASRR